MRSWVRALGGKYGAGAICGAAIAAAVDIVWVVRLMNDTSNPYRGEQAMGLAGVPFAAVLGAEIGVTVVMVWSGITRKVTDSET